MNGIIAWFVRHGIAANLLMVFILAGGLLTVPRLKQEVFPELDAEFIQITVEYLGAAPEEVEEGVCQRIEEAIYGVAGIKRIKATAREGIGTVRAELASNSDRSRVLDQIKTRIDSIDTFPEETEKPLVEELILRRQVIELAVSGQTDERSLRLVAERVRDEVAEIEGISLVQLAGARPYEVSIEVSEEALRRHGLNFDDVARAVRSSSLDLPGGSVKTAGGEFLLRAKGQAYRGEEFESITLMSRRDGTRIQLGEVATVVDGFEDVDQSSYFDGEPVILVQVFRVGDQGALDIAHAVHRYVEEARMPEGISLTKWQDDSAVLRGRLDLLIDNGLVGLLLVCLSLALFLRLGLALWVAWGIPLSFLGAVWLLPGLEVSVNVVSLFAFIVVLGLVVDDAIVVAENIYTHLQRGDPPMKAAIEGAQEVASLVIFAVLTSIAAFAPLLMIPGNLGQIMSLIPAVVIATLIFSLVESLLILPAHLSHLRQREPGKVSVWKVPVWNRPGALAAYLPTMAQKLFAGGLDLFIHRIYAPTLEFCLGWRYLTVATGIVMLLLTAGFVMGGHIKFIFFPPVDADNVAAMVTMPPGSPVEVTENAVRQITEAANRVRQQLNSSPGRGSGVGEVEAESTPSKEIFRHVLSSVGGQPYRQAQDQRGGRGDNGGFFGSNLGEVNIELMPAQVREITSTEIAHLWREACGPVPDAVELVYTSSLFSTGEAINIELASSNMDDLREAAHKLKEALRGYAGLLDITDSFRPGKQEVKLAIKPEAETLGLSLSDLARQVRQGFYGEEVQRIQRGRDDVRVMVRYPKAERRSLGDLESMRIRTADGAEVDFADVAEVEYGRGYAAIQRADRRRIISVLADVDLERANPGEVLAELQRTILPQLLTEYPGLSYSLEGEQREQRDMFKGLASGLVLAVVMIYGLLAIPFRSYFQPLIVMSAIPFGIVGVVLGHLIMGLELTFLSMFGLVALTGVVVNDSLIMVEFINRGQRAGVSVPDAVRQAGVARFRPILLTSLTTFVGLSPLLFEKSMQAQFLIPMAASLGFGVIFATLVTLILVPAGYLILEDLLGLFRSGASRAAPDMAPKSSAPNHLQ